MSPSQTDRQMTSRQRFQETMGYGSPDRVPLFKEGIREKVIAVWQTHGTSWDLSLSRRFHYDGRREIRIDLEPRRS